MKEWLDIYLDGLDWPGLVSSSEIEDRVLATYPRWRTRLPRLRRIISRALIADGYERRSAQGRAWSRGLVTQPSRAMARQMDGLIKIGE